MWFLMNFTSGVFPVKHLSLYNNTNNFTFSCSVSGTFTDREFCSAMLAHYLSVQIRVSPDAPLDKCYLHLHYTIRYTEKNARLWVCVDKIMQYCRVVEISRQPAHFTGYFKYCASYSEY